MRPSARRVPGMEGRTDALQHEVEGILRARLAEAQTEYVRLHDLWTALRS